MINNEWDILDLYFKNHKYPFTGHHLDSYRNFIKVKIPEIIKSNNPITMIKMDDNNNLIVKVDIYVGGINSDEIYVDRPILFENGISKLITPNDARMRNLTYVSNLFFTISSCAIITFSFPSIIKYPPVSYGHSPNIFNTSEPLFFNKHISL